MLVLVWMCLPNGPRKWQDKLSRQLGASISIKGVKTPLPAITELTGASIKIGESSRWNIDQITRKTTRRSYHYYVDAQPIASSDLATILKRIVSRQITSPNLNPEVHQLELPQLTVTTKLNSKQKLKIPLRDISISVRTRESNWLAECEFKIGSKNAKPVHCTLSIGATNNHPMAFSLNTNDSYVPIGLFHSWLPPMKHLGANAAFRGSLEAEQTPGESPQWSGSINGDIDQIDLYELVNRTTGLICSGTAKLTRLVCQFKNSKIISLKTTLKCGSGVFGPEFIRTFGKWPNVQIPANIQSSQPFTDLNVRIEIENSKVYLWSANPSQQHSNVIAFNSIQQALIAKPADSQSESIAFALRTLFPKIAHESVPMKDQAIWIINLFAK